MPNTNPVPDDQETESELFDKINQSAVIRVLPYASITKGLKGQQLTTIMHRAKEVVFSFTADGVGSHSAYLMLCAMVEESAYDLPIVAHCEDNCLVYVGVVY